jgi:hypothetical protein
MAMPSRFAIRFTGINRSIALLGVVPEYCRVEVDDGEVRVRMSWLFSLDAPRSQLHAAVRDHGRVWGWGAHGWRGNWLVNGSSQRLVRLEFEPPVHARTAGFPIRVRQVRVSVEDPCGLLTALATTPDARGT